MATLEQAFVVDLVETVPQLRSVLVRHCAENRGEILPHLFMADVMRQAVSSFDSETRRGEELVVAPLLSYLEDRFAQAEGPIQELIAVSFLENLPREGEPGFGLRALLGPQLSREAEGVA